MTNKDNNESILLLFVTMFLSLIRSHFPFRHTEVSFWQTSFNRTFKSSLCFSKRETEQSWSYFIIHLLFNTDFYNFIANFQKRARKISFYMLQMPLFSKLIHCSIWYNLSRRGNYLTWFLIKCKICSIKYIIFSNYA